MRYYIPDRVTKMVRCSNISPIIICYCPEIPRNLRPVLSQDFLPSEISETSKIQVIVTIIFTIFCYVTYIRIGCHPRKTKESSYLENST